MLLELVSGLLLVSAPEPAASGQPSAEKPEERRICRKQIETGSLIKGKKVCYTAKQWQQLADASRDEIERTASMGSRSGQ